MASTSRSTTRRSSTNCGARATSSPSASNTIDAPSKTSSSWPPTWLTYTSAHEASAARVASIFSRRCTLSIGVRRGVDVDDELGAAGRLRGDRPVRAPRVLADAHADPHAADDVQLERVGQVARREVAGLVEHGVVRAGSACGRCPRTAPCGADGGRVVEVPPGVDEADDRRAPPGAGGQLGQRGLRCRRRSPGFSTRSSGG